MTDKNDEQLYVGGGTKVFPKLGGNAVTTDKIADGAVTEAKLATGAVTNAKLASGAVTGDKVANNSLTTSNLRDLAVTTAKLNDGSVTSAKLVNGAVTLGKIMANAVTTTSLQDKAVTEAKLADNAVSTAKLQDHSVTADKIGWVNRSGTEDFSDLFYDGNGYVITGKDITLTVNVGDAQILSITGTDIGGASGTVTLSPTLILVPPSDSEGIAYCFMGYEAGYKGNYVLTITWTGPSSITIDGTWHYLDFADFGTTSASAKKATVTSFDEDDYDAGLANE